MIQFFSSEDCSWWSNSWLLVFHLFLFRSSKFSALSRREAPSKSSQGFTLCFQLLFLFIILLLPEFFMEAQHGGSSRIPFILHSFFKIFLKLRSTKLYSKINMVPNTCFVWGVQAFFILPSKVQFFLPYHLRWCYVILDNFPSCFMIHKLSGMTYS